MADIINFTKAKLELERKYYEQNLDTPITITRREIEEMCIEIVRQYASIYDLEEMMLAKIEEENEKQNT